MIDFFFSDCLLWLAGAKEYFLRKKLIIIRYNYIINDQMESRYNLQIQIETSDFIDLRISLLFGFF